jgi:hypothetical protein
MRAGVGFLLAAFLILSCTAWAGEATGESSAPAPEREATSLWDNVRSDWANFYSTGDLCRFAIGLGAAGVFANTSADESIDDWYQDSVRTGWTDDVAKVFKPFGNGLITVPVYLGAALLGHLGDGTGFGGTLGEWGNRSLRTLLVGAPPMLFLQYALGASRPEEDDSHWHFFEGHASVSGHAFVGAVPFLTAAQMAKNPYLRGGLYFGSTLCALSRINDDAHYFSQAALGWWIAYLAASSVARTETERQERNLTVTPVPLPGGLGVVVSLKF